MAKIEEQILNKEVSETKDPVADTPPTGGVSYKALEAMNAKLGIQQDSGIGMEEAVARKDFDINKYHAGIKYGEDFDVVAQENQTGWDLTKAATINVASEITLGTLAGIADIADIPNWVNLIRGSGDVYNSVLADFSKALNEKKQEIAEGAGKVYGGDKFDPGDVAWWAKNAGSMASTLTLMIPASGAVRGLGALSKIFRGSELGAKMMASSKIIRGMAYAAKSGTRSAHMAEAIISRIGENTMEARGVYDDTYRKVYESKVAELGDEAAKAEAVKAASSAASTTWRANSAMVLQDMFAYDQMYKAMAKMKKAKAAAAAVSKGTTKAAETAATKAAAKTAKETKKGIWNKAYDALKFTAPLIKDAAGEGLEEGYQYTIGEEAKRSALIDAGVLKDDRPFSDRMLSYMDSDEFKTSVAMGAVGGLLFGGAGAVRKAMAASKEDKAITQRASTVAMEMSAYLNNKDSFDKAKRNVFVSKALEKVQSGDLDVMREDLKIKLDASTEDLTADGIDDIPKFRKDVARSLKDLDTIEKIHEDVQGDTSIPDDLKPMLTMTRSSKIVLEGAQKDIKQSITDITDTVTKNAIEAKTKGAAEFTKALNAYAKESSVEDQKDFTETKKALDAYNAVADEGEKMSYKDFVESTKKLDTVTTLTNLHKADAYIDGEFKNILEAESNLKTTAGQQKLRSQWVNKVAEAVKANEAKEAKDAIDTLDATDMDVAEVDPADTSAEVEATDTTGESKFTRQANALVEAGDWEGLEAYIKKGIEVKTEGDKVPTADEIIKDYNIKFTSAQRQEYNKATNYKEVSATHDESTGHFATDRLPEGTTQVYLKGEPEPYNLSEPNYRDGKPGKASIDVFVVTGPNTGDKKVYNKMDVVFDKKGKAYFVTGIGKATKDYEFGTSLMVKAANRKGDSYYMKDSVRNAKATRLAFGDISNKVKRVGSSEITIGRQPIFHPNYKYSIELAKSRAAKAELASGIVKMFNPQYVDVANGDLNTRDNPLNVDFFAAGERLQRGINDKATLELIEAGEEGNPLDQDVIVLKQGDTVLGSMVKTGREAAFNNAKYTLKNLGNKLDIDITSKDGKVVYALDEDGKKITTSLDKVAGAREHPNGKVTILRVLGNNLTDRTAISEDGSEYETNFSDSTWKKLNLRKNHGKTVMVLNTPGGTDYFEVLGDVQAKDATINGKPANEHIVDILKEKEQQFTTELNDLISSDWERMSPTEQGEYGTKEIYAKRNYYDVINKNKGTDTELWKDFVKFKNEVLDGYVRHVSPYSVNAKGVKKTDTRDNRYFDYVLKINEDGSVVIPINRTYQQQVQVFQGDARADALSDRVLAVRDEMLEDKDYRDAVFHGNWVNCLQPQSSATYFSNINIEAQSLNLAIDGDIEIEGVTPQDSYVFDIRNGLDDIYAEAKTAAEETLTSRLSKLDIDSDTYEKDIVKEIKDVTEEYKNNIIATLKAHNLAKYITGIDRLSTILGKTVNVSGDKMANEFYNAIIRDSNYTGEDSTEILSALSKLFSNEAILMNAISANTIVANRKTAEEAEKAAKKKKAAEDKKTAAAKAATSSSTAKDEAIKHQTEHPEVAGEKVNDPEHNYIATENFEGVNLNSESQVKQALYKGLIVNSGIAVTNKSAVGDEVYAVVDYKVGRAGVMVGLRKLPSEETTKYIEKVREKAMTFPANSQDRKALLGDTNVYKNIKYVKASKVSAVNPKVVATKEKETTTTTAAESTAIPYSYYTYAHNADSVFVLTDEATGQFAELIGEEVVISNKSMADMTPVEAPDGTIDKANDSTIGLIKKKLSGETTEEVPTETTETEVPPVAPPTPTPPAPAPTGTEEEVVHRSAPTGFGAIGATVKPPKPPKVTSIVQDKIYRYQSTVDGAQTIGKGNNVGGNSYIIDSFGNSITADTKGAYLIEEANKKEISTYNSAVADRGTMDDVDSFFRVYDGEVPDRKSTETELEWLRNVLPNIPVEQLMDMQAMKNKFGKDSWGVFQNGLITVAANAAQGTVHHEAFHAVFNMYLDEAQRRELLDEASIFQGGSVREKEEYLANEFAKYMKNPKGYANRHRSLLSRVIGFFKKLFNFVTKSPNPSRMLEIYDKIASGDYATAEAKSFVNAMKEVTDKAVNDTSRNLGDYASYLSRLSDKERVALKRAIQENNIEIKCK